MKITKQLQHDAKKLGSMIREPAGKEWFAKHGMPKSSHHPAQQAMGRIQKEDSVKPKNERRVPHKAFGGTLHFSNPKSAASLKHADHLKTMEARKKGFHDATINRKRD